ncbi:MULTISPECIES: bifunctional biotin--[acetyl-CoA-carboxylase] ligase/biotin operon repressor BirA [unclassified Pseudoxanthomonas]|uniref:bifunctional biotin--[acetyl-CoA-carboxylase] ligase/biotin operon repressor BirA n=1 Tax=unclassified Pseudoxanthomonas TaxID=2645906 RepID=UPI0008E0B285|nr:MULTISPECIES: bifunctional biotin--[acetyl-CoA-carboxylase] ligase/biotin operon repressor BirA [unclassified Pseudoxanthomonas]PPJ41460.1 bifunctional biotin--[acetyl-CoA-carboxylase] ligase/biotin operon repressor BirA [Pseudoxanthomonas sp. KAs_5_3]SFV30240.1 BirA family transcriptional regulator, biotin operon repressor / biotin-[acetyl-CoA-carboxylase] ligase [Pseudoxanthomonas sp. YR558]
MTGERDLLLRLSQGPVSGDALARAVGQTRAAVWKRIETLREGGVRIDAQPGRGYALALPVELLEADRILAQTRHVASVSALEVAWSVDSTNSELLRRKAPAHGADVLLAEQQTGGRGRRGRHWASPIAANLYLSISRQFSGGLARLGGLSLVVGVAVAEAMRQAGYGSVGVKWPNDLLAGDRKLGGILVEGGGEHGGPVRAVIGIGLNVRMQDAAAGDIEQAWTDLARLGDGEAPSRNAIAALVLDALLPALDLFDADGLAPFLARYAVLDVLSGRAVTVHGPQGDEQGIADGIGADGALQVRIGRERRQVHAGDVSVRAT